MYVHMLAPCCAPKFTLLILVFEKVIFITSDSHPRFLSPGLAAFTPAGHVVNSALPKLDTNKNLSFSVDSIKMGNSNASFGSVAANDIKLQGTTVYIWAY